ncbi:hypothetical protein JG687_00005100 [Phytophthora cactorum]|uniref:Uncharacterized protein n=1 Tax=Phytophthora cactorum TaxID=29920 RepID=A0A8T1URI4_9STRA|nr:hypothetical protein JG687_00005100 [Phytophthora cactorum]
MADMAGASTAAVSIGNYKGVMLCNRPFNGVSSTLAKENRYGAKSNNNVVDNSKAAFLAGNPGEPLGLNVPIHSEPAHAIRRDKKNTALSKHKKWLYDLQKERARLQEALVEDEEAAYKRRERFSQREAKMREAVRSNNNKGEDVPNVDAGPAAETKKNLNRPMWALTKATADEKLDCLEDAEANDLIEFANNLDIDQFMDDVEIKARVAQVEQQLAQVQSIVDYEEAEEKRCESEQERLEELANGGGALNGNDLSRLGWDRAEAKDGDDDAMSVASSVLSECKSIRVASEVEEAKKHGMLHLIQYQLTRVPPELFSNSSGSSSSTSSGDLAATLVRLDLSFNQLEGPHAIPDAIGSLVALRELYVNNNPRLKRLPSSLAHCTKLQVLDASSSALDTLPQELGRLQHLRVINIDDTPLQRRWEAKGHLLKKNEDDEPLIFSLSSYNITVQPATTTSIGSPTKTVPTPCQQILRKLRRTDEREQLKHELFDLLHDKRYRLKRHDDSAAASAVLHTALRRVLKLFPQAIDVRSLLRNAERLFPQDFSIESFEKLDATRIRREFDVLRTATERKKRAADLELKIRNLYFDRIDPTTVERMVHQIYDHLPELSDIKFLIKYAPRLFPKEARSVNGEQIRRDLVALQQQFAQERAAAVDKLLASVKTLYSDTEPDNVRALVNNVAALFKNTKELLSLAADASVLFPADFLNAQPAEVRSSFLRMKAEVMGGSGASNVAGTTGAFGIMR